MFLRAVLAVLAFSAIYTVVVWKAFATPDGRAHYGEMYGGLAALFSGLAFAGVIVAIVMQREESPASEKRAEADPRRPDAAGSRTGIEFTRSRAPQVQLLILGTKLSANAIIMDHYNKLPAADPGSTKRQEHAKEVERLLTEINLESTQKDRPAGSL